ncbi:hypothetical protein SETIT_2G361700v2 [Setaria italica]|uniref:KIB1-4 beta-propeller domain-containing protein n=1 Tax=Setaria italica TaxID=4555 RepID=K3ZZS2_SETIT|nr:hypothetical protein SETIT_2G361700v2 [Setaria italica]
MATSDCDPPQPREWRDWASLGSGPAAVIAERALSNDYVDFLRFRAACRAWRECSAGVAPLPHGALDRRFLPRRWIMLPRRITSSDSQRWFLDVASGGCIRLSLPDLRHCYVLGRTAEGLLVLCRKDTYAVQLLNPLTGQVADLPDASTLLGLRDWSLYMALRNNFKLHGAGLVDGSTVMLHFGYSSLAIAKPGDDRWTRLEFDDRVFAALPFAGRIYCVTTRSISVVETVAGLPPELVVAVDDELDPGVCVLDRTCLLNDDGELVLAYRAWSSDEPNAQGPKYRMYRVKLGARKLVPLARLDGKAFFSGNSRSLLVSSGVSQSVAADTMYVCYKGNERTGQAKALAIGLHGGCCIELEHSFDKEDAAGYLSTYVCTSQD